MTAADNKQNLFLGVSQLIKLNLLKVSPDVDPIKLHFSSIFAVKLLHFVMRENNAIRGHP